MKLPAVIPPPVAVMREGLIVLGGILIAAFILSRFPKVRDWVGAQSLTVRDSNNNVLF
ncbi:MAG: hypothetical protein ACXW2U_00750 [Telluria sp.]